jgi:hypothetical protein
MSKRDQKKQLRQPTLTIEANPSDLFLLLDGAKIAKRGHPNSPQAGTWISLESGWRVLDDPQGGFVIEYDADAPIIH